MGRRREETFLQRHAGERQLTARRSAPLLSRGAWLEPQGGHTHAGSEGREPARMQGPGTSSRLPGKGGSAAAAENSLWSHRATPRPCITPRCAPRATCPSADGRVVTQLGASLVGPIWVRAHLPTPGTRVQALVQEDPMCPEQLSLGSSTRAATAAPENHS